MVDATGRRVFRSSAQVVRSVAHIDVPGSVLAEARYPLTIDPKISPEHAVSATSGLPFSQLDPAVATDGTA